MKKISKAQVEALKFLGGDVGLALEDGTPAAQIKIRTARPLLAAGLVRTDRSAAQIEVDAKAGGWVACALTDEGRRHAR